MTISRTEVQFAIDTLEDALQGHRERDTYGTPLTDNLERQLAQYRAMLPVAAPTAPETHREEQHLDRRPKAGTAAANQFGTFQVKYASEPQVRFIKRLMAERDTTKIAAKLPATLDGINKKAASTLIEYLLGCPDRPATEASAPRLASEKQRALIARLLAERDVNYATAQLFSALDVTAQQASEAIEALLALPKRQLAAPAVPLTVGVYRVEEKVYRVYPAQADRNRMLAKLLVVNSGEGSWEYAGMASRFVKPEHKMTREQAQQFGHDFGVCVVCGAALTDPSSVERGIGPVCYAKGGGFFA